MRGLIHGPRLKVFLPSLLLVAALLVRTDLLLQQQQSRYFERLSRTLAWETRAAAAGFEKFDLVELGYYPALLSAEVFDSEGLVLHRYSAPPASDQSTTPLTFRAEFPNSASYLLLHVQPLGWPTVSRDLPLAALLLFGLVWFFIPVAPGRWDAPTSTPTDSSPPDLPSSSLGSDGKPPPEGRPTLRNDPYRTGAYRHLVLELDKDLIVKTVSQGAQSYGLDPSELVGHPIDSFLNSFGSESKKDSAPPLNSRRETPNSVLSSVPIRNEQGDLEKVIVTVQDSLDEQQLMAERFAKLQQLFESICENASESILLVSPGRRTVYINPSFGRLIGKTADACIGAEFLNLLEPETRVAAADALHRALDASESTPLEFAVVSPSGRRSLVGAFYPVRRKGGAPRSALGIFRDITEERALTEELRLTEEQYRHTQKVEALGRLAGGVAHDFNNLLTIISVNLDFLTERISHCRLEECRNCLEELTHATGRAKELTQQLLLFSRKTPPSAQEVSVHTTVRKLLAMTGRLLGSDVALQTELSAERDLVYIDPGQLEQVLMNLIINARDAMPQGGSLAISSSLLKLSRQNLIGLSEGEYLVLKVRDKGGGSPRSC